MAMKKAEMAAHRDEYHARMSAARAAERQGLFRTAVQSAIAAWDFIDGMMQYERRYESAEFEGIAAVDLVLWYAPLLFEFENLDRLQTLLRTHKRIDRLASDDLSKALAEARAKMWDNHRLFSFLEAHPDSRQDELRTRLGGSQDYWRGVAEAWDRMGLLHRTPDRGSYRLALVTRMGQVVPGKCSNCGHVSHAPKAMLLEATTCPACNVLASFVFLSSNDRELRGE